MLGEGESTGSPTAPARNRNSRESLAEADRAIERALRSGVTPKELQSMLELKVSVHETVHQDTLPELPVDDRDTIHTELPIGLIDVPSAVKKYKLRPSTIYDWLKKGHLQQHGRLKGPVRGGGFLVIRESELLAYMAAPRGKGGRPRTDKGM